VDPLGLVLFAFDGTGNDKTDPQTLSNVVRFSDAYIDGDAKVYYITGPGTLDPDTGIENPLYKGGNGLDSGFSYTGLERVTAMEKYLLDYIRSVDDSEMIDIDIIGFSRGAAQAREFANRIMASYSNGYYKYEDDDGNTLCQKMNLRFMGLFDTVLSTHTGSYTLSIPAEFAYVAHAVALNEHRGDTVRLTMPGSVGAFPLESIIGSPASGGTRIEKGFIGAHSDIGGGFADGDLAKVALAWMVGQAEAAGVKMDSGKLPTTIAANPVIHDKTTNQHEIELNGRPNPNHWLSTFEDRKVRYMDGSTTTQIEMTGTGMTTADTYPFINYDPSTQNPEGGPMRLPGPDYRTGTVDMAGYLQWLNNNGYGINLSVSP